MAAARYQADDKMSATSEQRDTRSTAKCFPAELNVPVFGPAQPQVIALLRILSEATS